MEAGVDGQSGASQGLRHRELRQSQLQVSWNFVNKNFCLSQSILTSYYSTCKTKSRKTFEPIMIFYLFSLLRSRPDSFISLESDIASEQENDKSEIVEIEVSLD